MHGTCEFTSAFALHRVHLPVGAAAGSRRSRSSPLLLSTSGVPCWTPTLPVAALNNCAALRLVTDPPVALAWHATATQVTPRVPSASRVVRKTSLHATHLTVRFPILSFVRAVYWCCGSLAGWQERSNCVIMPIGRGMSVTESQCTRTERSR